jgi:hypothetical protein
MLSGNAQNHKHLGVDVECIRNRLAEVQPATERSHYIPR